MSDIAQSSVSSRPAPSAWLGLAPLVLIVFLGSLAVGVPLAALSLHVHDGLGFDAVVVGWVIGIQSMATVATRHFAGTISDRRGPKRAVLAGLAAAAASAALYVFATAIPASGGFKLALLIIGRLGMGLGESLFLTGAMSWGITRLGPPRTGKVMAWQGIAMYSAIGLGAPLGLAVQAAEGFAVVAGLATAAPLLAMIIAVRTGGVPASGGKRVPFYRVLGLIWRPGIVLTLATIPFACLAAFLALDYATKSWTGAGLAMSGFATGYVAVRLVGSHLPDRFGGVIVTTVSLIVETFGQALLWLADRPMVALAGAVITGIGFSLVFPSMGVEATRRVAPDARGRAVGNFIAFFDIALGITAPIVALMVGHHGFATAFLIGAGGSFVALLLLPGVRRM